MVQAVKVYNSIKSDLSPENIQKTVENVKLNPTL